MATRLLISEERSLITLSILLSATVLLALVVILIAAFVVIWKLVCKNENIYRTAARITSALQASVSTDTYRLLPREALVEHELSLINSAQGEQLPTTQMNKFTNYTAQEVRRFTDNFAEENEIGRGGSGTVFRGRLESGKQIAVKKLNASQAWSRQLLWAEVEAISRTHHKHVVSLMGCCWESQCLVYEYVSNGTLAAHLRKGKGKGGNPTIVHRDVKSGNILLDDDYLAKIADFGLAKVFEQTHVTTNPCGTFGYMSPRHKFNSQATTKSDVYSFGVVLLELITGMPAIIPQQNRICSLVSLVITSLEKNPLINFLDPSLEDSIVRKELSNMIMAAMGCLNNEATNRPTMLQVVQLLEYGIHFPSYILQVYDQHIILKLSNLISISSQNTGDYVMSDNVLATHQYTHDGYQPTSSFEVHFENEQPVHLRSMKLSQIKSNSESCDSKSNGSSLVDAYSQLSSLTFSTIGSTNEGLVLQQGDGGSSNHALLLENNDPVFGNCYNMNHQDQVYPNISSIRTNIADSGASIGPTTSNFKSNQMDSTWSLPSIREWNRTSSRCESG
ncbi:hypothetical protein O6H91_07G095800 [Diphasiastrum complanatum]|uniref:Uncharacterized protein n=1 Tax=Diphasiastrum complanatum TaxID=34168 RepID=A0ACC2D7X9_DIPCM|nr:hypothetical protein O6H91_07G095800 [Diphasiastrum complanatum]